MSNALPMGDPWLHDQCGYPLAIKHVHWQYLQFIDSVLNALLQRLSQPSMFDFPSGLLRDRKKAHLDLIEDSRSKRDSVFSRPANKAAGAHSTRLKAKLEITCQTWWTPMGNNRNNSDRWDWCFIPHPTASPNVSIVKLVFPGLRQEGNDFNVPGASQRDQDQGSAWLPQRQFLSKGPFS